VGFIAFVGVGKVFTVLIFVGTGFFIIGFEKNIQTIIDNNINIIIIFVNDNSIFYFIIND
jgi:hypothetical protein